MGCAGNTEGLDTYWQPQPAWSAKRFSDDYGYGIMTVFQEVTRYWNPFDKFNRMEKKS